MQEIKSNGKLENPTFFAIECEIPLLSLSLAEACDQTTDESEPLKILDRSEGIQESALATKIIQEKTQKEEGFKGSGLVRD